jgi:excisionase family DNA binding protein
MQPLVDAHAAARLLSVNLFTVYSLVRSRKLPAVRTGPSGRAYRFRIADLEAYAAMNLTTRDSEPEPAGAA